MSRYSEAEMAEIECDPVRLRAYFWNVAMRARVRSSRDKDPRTRRIDAQLSEVILDTLDALVESSCKKIEMAEKLL